MKKIFVLIMIAGSVILDGCTDLEESILDESLEAGGTTYEGVLAPSYAQLPNFFKHTNYFALQEISTDEAILPYRGGTDWGDNGIYLEMHTHSYTSQHKRVSDAWSSVTTGISYAVTAINVFREDNTEEALAFLAEARAIRAYYSMVSLDLFGLVFVKENTDDLSTILRGDEAVDYIESELLAVESQLASTTSVGSGRVSQEAVWSLLARLYLNAPVYRNIYASQFDFTADDMNKVITYSDKVINSGKFSLATEYFEIFDDENHNHPEIIFAVDQRADLNGHNRMAYFSLSGDQFPLPQFPNANGTDGAAITSDFYESWVRAYEGNDPANMDSRFFKNNLDTTVTCIPGDQFEIDRGILRGQQYGLIHTAKGEPFDRCDGDNYVVGKLYNWTRSNPDIPIIFTENIDFTTTGSGYSNGYRVEKYEFSKLSDTGRNKGQADIVIIRLADIYLMKAEAELRLGNSSAALADVNTVRRARTARVTPPALASIDLDILYRERGFEFYWEMLRRTDMIRFGKYEDSWTEKTNSDVRKRIFPIPQSAIDGASDLPGYLMQNESY